MVAIPVPGDLTTAKICDEEFVLERRVGETFVLGTATWRIEAIEPQRLTAHDLQVLISELTWQTTP